MLDAFRRQHGLHDDELSARERARAETLALEKFSTEEWTVEVA